MKLLKSILIFLLAIHYESLFSQTQGLNKLAQADAYFQAKNYGAALPYYIDLLASDPDNGNLNYKTGICYLQSRSLKTMAVDYLEKALKFYNSFDLMAKDNTNGVQKDIFKILGDAYQQRFMFDKAIQSYEEYIRGLYLLKLNKSEDIELIEREIKKCRFGKDIVQISAKDCTVREESYASDILYFNENTEKLPEMEIHTLPVNQGNTAESDKKSLGPDTVMFVSTVGASVDGKIILSYRDENGAGNLYLSKLHDNKWSAPYKLPKGINNHGWELAEYISPDGQSLYFVSDRPGGYGGKDIYRCLKNADGTWGKAVNLGPQINSPFDDEAPVMLPDGETLYFSSNRIKQERFDIFKSVLFSGQWSGPKQAGYPIDKNNKTAFYQVGYSIKKPDSTATKYSKKQRRQLIRDSLNKIHNGKDDSYTIKFLSQDNTSFTLIGGVVKTSDKNPLQVWITVADNHEGKILSSYYSENTGMYALILPQNKNNNISFEYPGYLFQSKNVNLQNTHDSDKVNDAVYMPLLIKKARSELSNIFFIQGTDSLENSSDLELKRLQQVLLMHPNMKIKIGLKGKTKDKAEKKLWKARASSVQKYLIKKGVKEENIKVSGKAFKEHDKKNRKNDKSLTQKLKLEIIKT